MSSHTQQNPSISANYQPAKQNQHSMIKCARINSFKAKTYQTTISPKQNIEPNTYSQAIKHICWQDEMKEKYDNLMKNNTW